LQPPSFSLGIEFDSEEDFDAATAKAGSSMGHGQFDATPLPSTAPHFDATPIHATASHQFEGLDSPAASHYATPPRSTGAPHFDATPIHATACPQSEGVHSPAASHSHDIVKFVEFVKPLAFIDPESGVITVMVSSTLLLSSNMKFVYCHIF
jgi:hypothetical protein